MTLSDFSEWLVNIFHPIWTFQNPNYFKLFAFHFTANHRARIALLISFLAMALNAPQGSTILVSYVTEISVSANPAISPIDSSIIITAILLISNVIFFNLVYRAGRRALYIGSSLATTMGLVFFALYLHYLTDK